MSTPSHFDDDARGELLCYLVVGELVAMARMGNWLKTGHLVELAHIWMNAHGARSDWQQRIAVTCRAVDLAPDVLVASGLMTEKALAPLFTDGWRPDDRLPVVCEIHDMWMTRLRRV